MEHKIIIEATGSSSGLRAQTSSDVASPSAPAQLGKSTRQLNLGQISVAALAAHLHLDAVKALSSVPMEAVSRIGQYTGNTLRQTRLNNVMGGLDLVRSLVTNPFTSGAKMAFKYADFNLQKSKEDNVAGYMAAVLNGRNGDEL